VDSVGELLGGAWLAGAALVVFVVFLRSAMGL
jgi:hypothetical protein